jgi:hypothetical protein
VKYFFSALLIKKLMSRNFLYVFFALLIKWFWIQEIQLNPLFISCNIHSLSLTSVGQNEAQNSNINDMKIKNFWNEIFPLQFYSRKKEGAWKFTNPTIPMNTHLFKDSVEKLIEKEWFQYQKIPHEFVLRPDGYPSMGLLLIEHIILHLKVSGTMDSLNIDYESNEAFIKSQSCFGGEPFQTKLNHFLQKHFMNILKKYIHPNFFVYISVNVPIRVHLVSTTITSMFQRNLKPFRVIILSASVIVKHFSQREFHIPLPDESSTELSFLTNEKEFNLQSSYQVLNCNYKAFMIYGEKPFQQLNNPQTNLDFKIIKFIHSYQQLRSESVLVTSETNVFFTCLEKNLYISSKFPQNSKSLEYCLTYPKRLNNAEVALIYLGWIPKQTIALHYRVFLYKNEWVKIPLIQTCTDKGWTPPELLLDLDAMTNMYIKCKNLLTQIKMKTTSNMKHSVTMVSLE